MPLDKRQIVKLRYRMAHDFLPIYIYSIFIIFNIQMAKKIICIIIFNKYIYN